jgi:hypothetical protein
MLFSGHYRRQAPPDLSGKKYVGLFQASGKLLKRLHGIDPSTKSSEQGNSNKLPEGATVIGGDGNAYLLTHDRVVIVFSSGLIKKSISFATPGPEFSAVRVQYSQGLVAISFAKSGNPEVVYRYLVVNALSGEAIGIYEPTHELGNDNVCFSRHDGFLFMTVENGMVKLITAPLR